MPVAIKTTKEDCSTKQEAIEFLQEATIMKEFKHDNIMALVGVVIEHDKALVLLPFMENGDLRSFISNDGNVSCYPCPYGVASLMLSLYYVCFNWSEGF